MNRQPSSDFQSLADFLNGIPAVGVISHQTEPDDYGWWIKLTIDINAPHAWKIVQELGHILNYLSLEEPLPTVFKPVSPPPYMNGGPTDFLSWVIECSDAQFTPEILTEWLEGRLPRPASDLAEWSALDN